MKRPVLLIFLDGLKPENVSKINLLNNLKFKSRLKGKYGYSIACHASMYTGLEISQHKFWFVWQKKKGSGYLKGPFFRGKLFDNLFFRLFWHKFLIRKAKTKNTSFFGIPRTVFCNTKDLYDLVVTEDLNYDAYGYLSPSKSFLDEIRDRNHSFDFVGFTQKYSEESLILDEWVPKKKNDFTYWFLGDVDHFSHRLGQDSDEANVRFEELSLIIDNAYQRYQNFYGTDPIILAWSDHGHAMVRENINLYHRKKGLRKILKTISHVADVTCLRLWKEHLSEKDWNEKLEIILSFLDGKIEVFSEQEMKKLQMWPGDNRYGDIVIMLKKGYAFNRTIWGFSRGVVSQHGYNPEDDELDGFVASNDIELEQKINISDIRNIVVNIIGNGN